MVQSPESSEYDGMLRSAIATGIVDYILTPAEMLAKLNDYNNQKFEKIPVLTHKTESAMKKIFNILNTKIGHDFSDYKEKTIIRRIERRMNINNFKSLDEYA
jgi:two-component system CheB/CheR fusion protein